MQEVLIATIIAVIIVVVVAIIVIVYASSPPAPTATTTPSPSPPPLSSFSNVAPSPPQPSEVKESLMPPNLLSTLPSEPTVAPPKLTFLATESVCHSDSECPGTMICARSKLMHKGQSYENAVFDKYDHSLTDVATLNGKLYFILDEDKIAIVEPQKETKRFSYSPGGLREIVALGSRLYLRTKEGKLLVFDGLSLEPVPLNVNRVAYMNVTPDNQYIYLNDTLYDINLKPVNKMSWGKRVFWTPDTFLLLEPKIQLVQQGQVISSSLPSTIKDAAFNTEGELFLVEDDTKYSHIRVIADEPFLFTARVCRKEES